VAREPYTFRFRPHQAEEIRKARELRRTATELRARVSRGTYDDGDLAVFWGIVAGAGIILKASNPQLGARVGLGESFFSSVARERRRPKLTSFLRALESIIETADERLADVGPGFLGAGGGDAAPDLRLARDREELFVLASCLAQTARSELERIDDERPNDPDAIERNQNLRNVLLLLANGFEQIAEALAALSRNPQQTVLLERATEVVRGVGKQVSRWWDENGLEVIDWSVRLPVLAGGVAMLNLAGAQMTVGTTAVAALVGGEKVLKVIARSRGKK
jgi:hypothetical protein